MFSSCSFTRFCNSLILSVMFYSPFRLVCFLVDIIIA
nr:MAG TPA: hypothetical protein [Caudoviricetes sp.]